MTEILVPVSYGELVDKVTILRLKEEHISSPDQLMNIRSELARLDEVVMQIPQSADLARLWTRLAKVNHELWEIEDAIRNCEARQDFGAEFVRLARSVYKTNDQRAAIKREINVLLGSNLMEEKSYGGLRL